MNESDVTVTGSCLCRSIEYKVTGEAMRFSHCHCQRCRKATGTGHASNFVLTPVSGLKWIKGEDLLTRYKVPEAERFYNCFCKQCGSPMPRTIPEINAVLIPAGSLDVEPPLQPQHHIFWDSRADWSCDKSGLPVYNEYPEE